MIAKDFLEGTVCKLDAGPLALLKEILLDEYVSFSIVKESKITAEVLAEKLVDYFATVEVKLNRPFGKMIESFMGAIDDVIAPRIAKAPQVKKGETTPVIVPRARKYYEKAVSARKKKDITYREILDFSRVMFCLYTASIDAEDKVIENFNFSSACIEPYETLDHLKSEETQVVFPPSKRKRFDFKEKFGADSCTMVIAAIVICVIVNERNQGGIQE